MGSKVRNLLSAAAPLAGLIPGIGLPAQIALGAGGGLLSGGGLKSAITGGLGAAALGGGGKLLGGALGLGTDTLGQSVGTGLLGAGAGGASGGVSGALLGGAAGGIGGYANAGGFDGLGASLGLTGENSLLGTAASNYGQFGPTQTGATLSQPGSGILGAATRGLSDIGSALSTGTGGGGSSYSGLGGALLGGINSISANNKAQEDLMESQRRSIGEFQPYLDSGRASNTRLSELLGTGGDSNASDYGSLNKPFTAEDLTQDPGYQFQLQQGQQAIDRSLGAKGKMFSGEALKATQEYGQGLADQTYKDAYARDLANKQNTYSMFAGQNQQGQGAAGSAANIYDNIGNAKANAGINTANIVNQSLSSLLSGSGAKKRILGADGNMYYVTG